MGNPEPTVTVMPPISTILPSTRIPGDLMDRLERFCSWWTPRARRLAGVIVERPDAVRYLLGRGLAAVEEEMRASESTLSVDV